MREPSQSTRQRRHELGIVLDPANSLSLQHQLRQRLIDAINRGTLRPGGRVPSSRRLAEQIGVSRNTVALAYDALLAAGHLVSRPRSGIFVAPNVQGDRVTTGRRGLAQESATAGRDLASRLDESEFRLPPNWDQHPYPFLDGCHDTSLVPADAWREALRIAFGKRDLLRWSGASPEIEDARLSEELRTKVLPSWGLDAAPEETLCAASARNALFLVVEALATRDTPVLLDDGADPEIRQHLSDRKIHVTPFNFHDTRVSLLETLPSDSLVLLGGRRPAGANPLTRERAQSLLAAAARSNAVIVESMPTPHLREPRHPAPALRALDSEGRVIFIGALSAAASLGPPPAILCGDRTLIERIRHLRRMTGSEPPAGMLRAWAYFIGLGSYAAAVARAATVLQERRTALRDALNHYLHKFVSIQTPAGSSAYWVRGGQALDATGLAHAAAAIGILIEPACDTRQPDLFCMGVTSLPKQRIREGVEKLARLVRRDRRLDARELRHEATPVLRGKSLQRALSGTTLLYNTVYGDPCTIEVLSDGSLVGRAGYANEDCDSGRWWIEDDRWFRQWNNWAYGEAVGFQTVVDGDQVRWFNTEGALADTAVIVRGAGNPRNHRSR